MQVGQQRGHLFLGKTAGEARIIPLPARTTLCTWASDAAEPLGNVPRLKMLCKSGGTFFSARSFSSWQ